MSFVGFLGFFKSFKIIILSLNPHFNLTFATRDTTWSSLSWSIPFSPWLDLFELVRGGGGGGAPFNAVDFRVAGRGIGVLAGKDKIINDI